MEAKQLVPIIVVVAIVAILAVVLVGSGEDSPDNSPEITVDYESAESLESDLTAGKDATGKTVSFIVKDIKPDSFFGYNLVSGEHLNFCSTNNPNVNIGDTVTVKITEVNSFIGSWIIYYEKV